MLKSLIQPEPINRPHSDKPLFPARFMCHNGEGLPASVGSVLFGLLHGRPQIQPFNEFYFLMNPRQADNVRDLAPALV
jgi:hypothetical protein